MRVGRKKSDFGLQLDEKQKLRYFYGFINEKQFKNYYKVAKRKSGNTGTIFLQLLERRLDTAVYRMNFAPTIFSARQLVSHGHVLVNGQRIKVPSFVIQKGDKISIKDKSKNMILIKSHVEKPERSLPTYVIFEKENMLGIHERYPEREEIAYPFELNEALIVEFYSK